MFVLRCHVISENYVKVKHNFIVSKVRVSESLLIHTPLCFKRILLLLLRRTELNEHGRQK